MNHSTWEYLTTSSSALADDQLSELGAAGWELVAIHEDRAFFKRIGPDYRERATLAQKAQLVATREETSHEA